MHDVTSTPVHEIVVEKVEFAPVGTTERVRLDVDRLGEIFPDAPRYKN